MCARVFSTRWAFGSATDGFGRQQLKPILLNSSPQLRSSTTASARPDDHIELSTEPLSHSARDGRERRSEIIFGAFGADDREIDIAVRPGGPAAGAAEKEGSLSSSQTG